MSEEFEAGEMQEVDLVTVGLDPAAGPDETVTMTIVGVDEEAGTIELGFDLGGEA